MAGRGGAVFAQVHALVARIPRGRVATYGLLSDMIEGRLSPVGIGWAMRAAPDGLPWHRVINARGTVSTEHTGPGIQRTLLEAEGIEFDDEGRCDLERYLWRPRVKRSRPGERGEKR